jgi:hypothetical protein
MYPGTIAAQHPDRPAVVMGGSGEVVTFRELDERSNRLAHLLRAAGLGHGDHVALLMENHPRFLEVVWAALRSGLYLTAINSHLTSEEATYIVGDCGARAIVTSGALGPVAAGLDWEALSEVTTRLVVGADLEGFERYEDAVSSFPTTPVPDERTGARCCTPRAPPGRPKGVPASAARHHPTRRTPAWPADRRDLRLPGRDGLPVARHRCTTPPARLLGARRSASADRRDHGALRPGLPALALIERSTGHPQPVGADDVRAPAAAPRGAACRARPLEPRGRHPRRRTVPGPVKHRMIEWWGPILHEYYAGTEGNGSTGHQQRGVVGPSRLGRSSARRPGAHHRPDG